MFIDEAPLALNFHTAASILLDDCNRERDLWFLSSSVNACPRITIAVSYLELQLPFVLLYEMFPLDTCFHYHFLLALLMMKLMKIITILYLAPSPLIDGVPECLS